MRASMRENSSRDSGPVSWVESTRSVGAWKLPTLSAREWRRAALDALGANGSWTLTMSSGSAVSASSIVRATSTGSDAARRRAGANGSTSPTPSTVGVALGVVEQLLGMRAQRAAAVAHQRGVLGRARR